MICVTTLKSSTIDLSYGSINYADKHLPLPSFGVSYHNSVYLLPVYITAFKCPRCGFVQAVQQAQLTSPFVEVCSDSWGSRGVRLPRAIPWVTNPLQFLSQQSVLFCCHCLPLPSHQPGSIHLWFSAATHLVHSLCARLSFAVCKTLRHSFSDRFPVADTACL